MLVDLEKYKDTFYDLKTNAQPQFALSLLSTKLSFM